MDANGIIHHIGETQQVSDRFRKREIVLELDEKPEYPEFIKFEFTQDKCDILDRATIGGRATIWYDLRGRKWTDRNGDDKYFVSLQGWRIEFEQSANRKKDDEQREQEPRPGAYADVADEIPF